jgi:hypothetical protein
MELFDCIEMFYNQRRRHSTLGQISPATFERRATAASVDPMKTAKDAVSHSLHIVSFYERQYDDEERSAQRNRPLKRIRPEPQFGKARAT